MSTTEKTYKPNGRDTYDTSVSKFLIGGKYSGALRGYNKIVNGMDDPSHLAFVFGIVPEFSGLFGQEYLDKSVRVVSDFENDRHYGALDYFKKSISENFSTYNDDGSINNKFKQYDGIDLSIIGNNETESEASDIDEGVEELPKEVVQYNTDKYNAYLSARRTFPTEYENMMAFVNGFMEICKAKQYIFQTVEGLQDAYKKFYNNKKDSFLGGSDNKIKITCLESMDLRMTALFDAYYKAVFNHNYRRMNIPHNLIRFNCYIMLHDLRNIVPQTNNANDMMRLAVTDEVVKNMSTVVFVFKNCTIDIEECGQSFSSTSNVEVNETKFDFTFTYGDVDIVVNSLADFLASAKKDDSSYRARYDTLDIMKIQGDGKQLTSGDYQKSQSLDDANRSAYGKSLEYDQSEMFGNVYEDDFTLNIGNMLKKVGSMTFNYLTNGTQMGNVYDESWAGIVANLVSSISNGGLYSIASQYISKGKTIVMEKLDNYARERFGNNGGGETNVLTNTDLNPDNANRGARPSGYGGTRSVSNGTLGNLDMNPRNAPSGPTKLLGQI